MDNKKYAVVTGATSGIGFELAKLLAQDSYNLVIGGRDIDTLKEKAIYFKEIFQVEVIPIVVDLFDRDDAFQFHEEIINRGIEAEILVNDAGQGQYGEFVNTDIGRELQIIDLNIVSVVVLTKLFLKDMVARGSGRILNLSSVASKIPGPWQSVYHGTKAFIQSFTEAIREETKDSGVTITALLPGATATDFFRKAAMLNAKMIVEGKLADPADVAKDGYEAMMAGKDMVISGFKNKAQVLMGNMMPDSSVAHNVYESQKPVDQ